MPADVLQQDSDNSLIICADLRAAVAADAGAGSNLGWMM